MNGKIHAYSAAASAGLISGTDGNFYAFGSREWTAADKPAAEQPVTFTVRGSQAFDVKLAAA